MEDKNIEFKDVQDILEKSPLSQEDKKLWLNRCENMPTEVLASFVSTFSDDAEMLISATETLKNKINAGDDIEKMKKIVEEEKIELLRQYI